MLSLLGRHSRDIDHALDLSIYAPSIIPLYHSTFILGDTMKLNQQDLFQDICEEKAKERAANQTMLGAKSPAIQIFRFGKWPEVIVSNSELYQHLHRASHPCR